METKLLPAITASVLGILYILNPGPLPFFITLLFLTGLTFSAAALSGELFNDMTWAIIAGGSAYWGLSLIAPRPAGLTVALTVMLIPFMIPLSNHVGEWRGDEWRSYSPVVLAGVAIGGVYLGSYLTPWIVMSPFLELAMEKASRYRGEEPATVWGVYYIVIYALSLRLNPILALYAASLSLARRFKPGLGGFNAIPIDSLVRLSLWVTAGWITGL